MDKSEIDRLAKALFESENKDATVRWDTVTTRAHTGTDSIPGVGEDVREKYRQRVRRGEQ